MASSNSGQDRAAEVGSAAPHHYRLGRTLVAARPRGTLYSERLVLVGRRAVGWLVQGPDKVFVFECRVGTGLAHNVRLGNSLEDAVRRTCDMVNQATIPETLPGFSAKDLGLEANLVNRLANLVTGPSML